MKIEEILQQQKTSECLSVLVQYNIPTKHEHIEHSSQENLVSS